MHRRRRDRRRWGRASPQRSPPPTTVVYRLDEEPHRESRVENESELAFELNQGRTAANLRALNKWNEVASLQLKAPELDQLIRLLANLRAKMADPVAPDLDEESRLKDVVPEPPLRLSRESPDGRLLVALRHPGLGWLGFRLRRKAVEALIPQLKDWLKEQPDQ